MLNIKKAALWACVVIATVTLMSTIITQQPRAVDAKVLRTAGADKDAPPGTWLTYFATTLTFWCTLCAVAYKFSEQNAGMGN